MPAGVDSCPVVGFGSGKFKTPCARMHRETASSRSISSVLTCRGGALTGAYLAHAR